MIDLVAVDKNWGIGKDNDLLIEIPEDKKFFKDTTINKVVFMGRNTLDSLPGGKPLKNRVNIVLTSKEVEDKSIVVVRSVEEVLKEVAKYEKGTVYNIGGAQIFKKMLDYAEYSLVTKIDAEFDADVYYPNLDKLSNWEIVEESEEKYYEGIKYQFFIYKNKNFK